MHGNLFRNERAMWVTESCSTKRESMSNNLGIYHTKAVHSKGNRFDILYEGGEEAK